MLNISSSLRGVRKKTFLSVCVYNAFVAGREKVKLFFLENLSYLFIVHPAKGPKLNVATCVR